MKIDKWRRYSCTHKNSTECIRKLTEFQTARLETACCRRKRPLHFRTKSFPIPWKCAIKEKWADVKIELKWAKKDETKKKKKVNDQRVRVKEKIRLGKGRVYTLILAFFFCTNFIDQPLKTHFPNCHRRLSFQLQTISRRNTYN